MLTAATAAPGCHGATQLEIVVTTDVPCNGVLQTAIYKGLPFEAQPAARTDSCSPRDGGAGGDIGSIVFVPSGDRNGRGAVKVVFAADGDVARCATDPKACIVATRSFSFLEHRSRRLPIQLLSACFGKQCGPGFTCNPKRDCVPDVVECTGVDCRSPADLVEPPPVPPPPVDPPVDPGVDAGKDVDASPAPSCGGSTDGVLATVAGAMPSFAAAEGAVFYYLDPQANGGLGAELFRVDAAGSGGPSSVATISTDGSILGLAVAGSKWAVAYDKPVGPSIRETLHTSDGIVSLTDSGGNGIRAIDARVDGADMFVDVVRPASVDRVHVVKGTSEGLLPFGGERIAHDSGTIYVAGGVAKGPELVAVAAKNKAEAHFPLDTTSPVLFAKHLDVVYMGVNGDAASSIVKLAGLNAPSTLTTEKPPVASLAVDGTNVYFTNGSDVKRVPRSGFVGGTTPVYKPLSGERLGHLAVTATCVYFWEESIATDPPTARLRGIPKLP